VPRVWLQAAAGGAFNAGGLSRATTAGFGVRLQLSQRWSATGSALLPLSAATVTTDRGSAAVNVYLLGATLGVVPWRSNALDVQIALGGGAALSAMRGTPSNPTDEGRTQSLWAGVGLAEVSTAWSATPWLRLRLAALGGIAAARPTVRFNGESVASWGRPLAYATLGVEFDALAAVRGAQ
jgi:hypothetical protein